jgi:hypothetical protein
LFLRPGFPRHVILAQDDLQVQLSGLDARVVAVAQQHEPRYRIGGETIRRLVVDHPLDAICRRRFHGRLLERTRNQDKQSTAADAGRRAAPGRYCIADTAGVVGVARARLTG